MSKEKSTTELRDERNQLLTRGKTITGTAKTEKRQLKPEENEELGTIQVRLAEINLELEEKSEMNEGKGKSHGGAVKRFSLLRALRESISGGYSEETLAVIERGKAQMSGMETTGA
jgi:hypothetical protein